MAKKEIRLQYSGFVLFGAKMLSVATGLIFQLMVARALVEHEYNLWFNINDVLPYFTLLAGVLPFWAMRFAARGKEGAVKTGILANIMISIVATLIYLSFVPLITSALSIGEIYLATYFIAAIQIFELYSIGILEACLQAKTPHVVGYGLLIQQIFKVVLGYVLIFNFQQSLFGAVLAIIVTFSIQMIYYFKLLMEELKEQIKWEYIREWLKGSVANIYNVIGNQIANFVFIMLFSSGSATQEIGARGVYGIASQIASVILHSSFLAFALYPKLLTERKSEDITTSLKMVLMFAVPMTTMAIVLSDSYVVMMRPEYKGAAPVLIVLAIDAFVATISTFFASVLFGIERVDEKAKISFKELTKSRLFFAFSLPYFHSAITLPTTYYVLSTDIKNQPFQAALYVSIINSLARFAMFFVLYIIVRKMVKIGTPWKSIAKYILVSITMGIILFIIPHSARIYVTLIQTATGGIVYLVLLMTIDKEARMLLLSILQEVRRKIGR